MRRNFILVRRFAPVAPDGIKPSLIEVPDTVKQPNPFGEVIAAGPGFYDAKNRFTPTLVKPGDVIVMPQYAKGEEIVPWYGQSDAKYAAEFGIKLKPGEQLVVLPDSVISAVIEDYVQATE